MANNEKYLTSSEGHLQLYGHKCIANGYSIIPIRPREKRPAIDAWPHITSTPRILDNWLCNGLANTGIGINLGRSGLVAVDIDVTDEHIARELQYWCESNIDFSLCRIGNAPKRLLLYRSNAPLRKMTSRAYFDHHENKHRVEILGDGQQFVAFGIHPSTGKEYRWIGDTPAITPAENLAFITEDIAKDLFHEFDRLAKEAGWKDRSGSHFSQAKSNKHHSTDPFSADVSQLSISSDELRQKLMLIPGAHDYDTWIKIGMGLYHQFNGDIEGLGMWIEWSATADNFNENECHRKWRSFDISDKNRTPITARSIIELAKSKLEPDTLGDTSNGRRFSEKHRDEYLYCFGSKKWLRWVGTRFSWCENGEEVRAAQKVADDILRETTDALTKCRTDIARRDHSQALAVHRSKGRIDAMLAMASTNEGMSIANAGKLDADPWLLGVPNGVIDLRVGTLCPPLPDMLISKQAGASFDPDAGCPLWKKFLADIFLENQEVIDFIQRALGYTLTGSVTEEKLFFMYGTGANGKSVMANVISSIFGDYAVTVGPELLSKNSSSEGERYKNRLPGVRLALANEVSISDVWDDQKVKTLASRERITARFLHCEAYDFMPTHKLFIRGNHQPGVLDSGDGLWRRIVLIPFKRQFSETERDQNLEARLLSERDGILMWILEGCLAWQRLGSVAIPDAIARETAEYRSETDVLGSWLEECCNRKPGERTHDAEAYWSYQEYMHSCGIKPLSKNSFSRRMREAGYESMKSNGKKYITGLQMSSTAHFSLGEDTDNSL